MAFRRRFSGFKRRSSGLSGRQKPRWFGQSADLTLTAAVPVGSIPLLTAAQMQIGQASLEQELLLTRVVGRITVSTLAATVAAGAVGIGFLKTQFPAITAGGFQDPLVAANLGTLDWLRLESVQAPPNAGPQAWLFARDVDIRVKRRMKGEDGLILACSSGLGVDSVVITADIRILIVVRI